MPSSNSIPGHSADIPVKHKLRTKNTSFYYSVQRIFAILCFSALITNKTSHTSSFYITISCAAYAGTRAAMISPWRVKKKYTKIGNLHCAPSLRVQLPGTQQGSTCAHSVVSLLPQSHSSSPSTMPLPHSCTIGSNNSHYIIWHKWDH